MEVEIDISQEILLYRKVLSHGTYPAGANEVRAACASGLCFSRWKVTIFTMSVVSGLKKILRRAVTLICVEPTVVEAHEAAVLKLVSLSRGFVYKVARSSVHTVTQIITLFKVK